MILSMSGQAQLFLTAVLYGAVIGVLYDTLRVFRIILPHKNIFVQIEDLLFWLFATGFIFNMVFNKNSGEIRAFTVLGALLGMIVYFLSVSKPILKAVLFVTRIIIRIIATMLKIILFPFRLIYKLLEAIVKFCLKEFNKAAKPVKKVLHKSKKYVKIRRDKYFRDLSIILRKK